MSDTLITLKEQTEDFEIEYEVLPIRNRLEVYDLRQQKIQNEIQAIDDEQAYLEKKLAELNENIDKLTNHADGIDYTIAVGSGVLAGLIDVLFVGEFSLERADKWGSDKVEEFVVKVAQNTKNSQGKSYTGNNLHGAVQFLEKNFEIAADKATSSFGGGLQHHLRDFSHHPTVVGLFFSMLTQFTECVYGTDVAGNFMVVPLKKEDLILIGKNIPEKISFGFTNWVLHLISDVAGSSDSIYRGKRGTGIPGPILSMVKEISSLPIFNKMDENGYKELSVTILELFNGTLLVERDEIGNIIKERPFDFRTEIGVGKEIGRQAIPIVINECIVRSAYFFRRLYKEIKDSQITSFKDLNKINWKNTLPFKNRTITRMITISMGTFCAIDLTDASIRAAVKSGGNPAMFMTNVILRVNFVGIGRFAIAIGTEVSMEYKKGKLENERMAFMNKNIMLSNAKVFYKQADVWIELEKTQKSFEELMYVANQAIYFYIESWNEIEEKMEAIDGYIEDIRETNPDLKMEMLDLLEW